LQKEASNAAQLAIALEGVDDPWVSLAFIAECNRWRM
jgi:hypothetical protein